MSQTFQITWVGDQTREWESKHGTFVDYRIALAGYDPSENDPEAGKTVVWTRKPDSQRPAPGDEVFGHIEVKQFDWGTKYSFKQDQSESGGPPSGAKKVSASAVQAPLRDERDAAWFLAKDMRISYAGILQAVIAGGNNVGDVFATADRIFAGLNERFPHPSATPKAQNGDGPEPEGAAVGLSDPDDDIPF